MGFRRDKKAVVAVGIIPARSGSKGIPNKNIRLLAGKPLIYYTIKAGLEASLLSRLVVSTDSMEIAEISEAFGAEVPFLRPPELARDDTLGLPVVRHAVKFLEENQGYRPDIIVTLQPTSPLRRAEHIDAAVTMLIETKADSVVSLCEAEHSPYWMRALTKDGRLKPILSTKEDYMRRQDLPRVYRFNGAVYASKYSVVMEEKKRSKADIRALIMDREDSIDIDEELDFQIAEMILVTRRQAAAAQS